MVNRALVLCTRGFRDDTITPLKWEEYELMKANWFIDALMMWGYTRNNITFLRPENPVVNTHGSDGPPTMVSFNEKIDILKTTQDSEYVVVFISDYTPCTDLTGEDSIEKGIHFTTDWSSFIDVNNLKFQIMDIQRAPGQDKLTVIVSGRGVDEIGHLLKTNQYQTMISHDSNFVNTIFKANLKKDLFNIGGMMPLVDPNNFQQAFSMERNRCINLSTDPQYPKIFLE